MITANIEVINPKIAAKYLENNTASNRNLSSKTVENYARQMRNKQWQLNGDAIRFDSEGNLIDGQHRLHAVIKSGSDVNVLVVRGLESETFKTIDTGKKRSVSDIFSIGGNKDTVILSASARAMYNIMLGYKSWKGGNANDFNNTIAVEFLDKNKDLVEAVAAIKQFPNVIRYLSPGSAGALYCLMARKDRQATNRFFLDLHSGSNLNGDSVIYQLRERLIRNLSDQFKLDVYKRAALTVKAWNYIREGRNNVKLIVNSDLAMAEIK